MNWSRLLSFVSGGLHRRLAVGKAMEITPALAESWTVAVYSSHAWLQNSWLGFPILQLPNDLMIMQEIIVRTRPSVIVETGTFHGGSAIFYASVLSQLGAGRVISVDVERKDDIHCRIQEHPLGERIVLIVGDSVHPETVERVSVALHDEESVLVTLAIQGTPTTTCWLNFAHITSLCQSEATSSPLIRSLRRSMSCLTRRVIRQMVRSRPSRPSSKSIQSLKSIRPAIGWLNRSAMVGSSRGLADPGWVRSESSG